MAGESWDALYPLLSCCRKVSNLQSIRHRPRQLLASCSSSYFMRFCEGRRTGISSNTGSAMKMSSSFCIFSSMIPFLDAGEVLLSLYTRYHHHITRKVKNLLRSHGLISQGSLRADRRS